MRIEVEVRDELVPILRLILQKRCYYDPDKVAGDLMRQTGASFEQLCEAESLYWSIFKALE